MNTHEMIIKYLTDNGFDGLFSENECACELADLMPCGEDNIGECRAGYKVECLCGGGHKFHICENKLDWEQGPNE